MDKRICENQHNLNHPTLNQQTRNELAPPLTAFSIEQEAQIANAIFKAFEELKEAEVLIHKESQKKFLWITLDQWKSYGAVLSVIAILFGAFAFISAKPSLDNVKTTVVETLDERRTERNKEIEKLIDLKAEPIRTALQNIEHTLQEIKEEIRK